jgi:prepilin-type N-terminal cleavage/methylation domain-containing protein
MKSDSAWTQSGFTLLELSIVVTIISVVLAGGFATLTSSIQTGQLNATVTKMDNIETALLNFAVAQTRIPCPSDLTQVSTSATYGYEAGAGSGSTIGVGTGVCTGTGMLPQANFVATSKAAEGGVPTRALELSDDYMYDGWGHRFRYAADPSATMAGSLPSLAFSCSPITINDSTGAIRSAAAIYAIISHGANGHGAYTSNGVAFNAGSVNTNEQTNCHCNSSAMPTPYAPTYVEMAQTQDTTNALDNFDDMVTFKEAWQLQTANTPVTPGFMYIADYQNDRIREVSATMAGIITTFVGNGTGGYSGDGGPATSANLFYPYGVAVDSSGNLYIADYYNNRIRMVTASTGIITTVAGNGTEGYSGDGGPATSAELNNPTKSAVDSSGNLYIADYGNQRVRMVTASTGIITTVAGNGTAGYSGDGGAATSAELWGPYGVAVDSSGNLYIVEIWNFRIRKVTASTGIITTVAGNGTSGYSGDNGAATSAELWTPYGVAVDSSGNLYIADYGNNRIRKVTASTGIITTIAGNGTAGYSGDGGPATSAKLHSPTGSAVDSSGNLYISEYGNNRIRKVTASGTICTVAGNGTSGYSGDNGAATSAELHTPSDIAVSRVR